MKSLKISLTAAVLLTLSSSVFAAQTSTQPTGADIAKAGVVMSTDSKTTPTTATTASTAETTTPKAVSKDHKMTAEEQKADAKAKEKAEAAEKLRKERIAADGYSDISDHWAKNAIKAMSEKHYVSGFYDSTFRPNEPITREQIASIYNKLLVNNYPTDSDRTRTKEYSDVENERWSKEAITNVSKAGIMSNYIGSKFAPEHQMTREEFAYTAASFAKYMGLLADNTTATSATFKDANTISTYAKDSVLKLAQAGYLKGDTTGNFNPTKLITRAEAVSVMYELSHPQGETKDSLKKYANTQKKDDVTKSKTDNASKVPEQRDITYDAPFDKVDTKTTDKADVKATDKVDTKSTDKADTKTSAKTNTKPVVSSVAAATPAQTSLEDKVFAQLNKLYKTPGEFQNHGVMYWEGSRLHVAVQNSKDLAILHDRFSQSSDSDLRNKVLLEVTRYSQAQFDEMDSEFQKLYAANEPTGSVISTVPDVQNDRLYAVVSSAKSTTVKAVQTKFGTKVKMALQK